MYLVNASSVQRLRLCGMTGSLLNKSSIDLEGLNIDSLNIANLGKTFYKYYKYIFIKYIIYFY